MRAEYARVAGLDAALGRVRELSVRTVIFDVEPLIAYWDSGQDALDRGLRWFSAGSWRTGAFRCLGW